MAEKPEAVAGPSGYKKPVKRPSGYKKPDPGPSGYTKHDPGPSGYKKHDPGPSGYKKHDPGPSGYKKPDPGPSGYKKPDQGPSGYKEAHQRPSAYDEPAKVEMGSGLCMPEDPIIQLYDSIEWLKNMQKELKVSINYEKNKEHMAEIEALSNESLCEKIGTMLDTIYDETNELTVQDTIVQNLQLADVLYKAVTGSLKESDEADDNLDDVLTDEIQEELQKLLYEKTELSSEIAGEQKIVNALEDEILDEEAKLNHMTAERNKLMKKIQIAEDIEKQQKHEIEKKNERLTRLKTEFEREKEDVVINNHILQLLIAFSGINWAKDAILLKMAVDCGKPLEQQLAEM